MMRPEEEYSKVESDLEGARRDLEATLHAVNLKIARTVNKDLALYRPENLIKEYPVPALCAAAALGFVIGFRNQKRLLARLAMLGLEAIISRQLMRYGVSDDAESSTNGSASGAGT